MARERFTGGFFLVQIYYGRERVHRGKGCTLSFFLLYFTIEGEGGGGECFFFWFSFDMWKKKGKGIYIYI